MQILLPHDDVMAELAAIRADLAALKARLDPPPEWLPMAEYARQHHISERTVQRLVARGAVETRRIGGRVLVRA